jgi:hypothetical protein
MTLAIESFYSNVSLSKNGRVSRKFRFSIYSYETYSITASLNVIRSIAQRKVSVVALIEAERGALKSSASSPKGVPV